MGSPPTQLLAIQPCLASARGLKELNVRGLQLQPAELALIGLLTTSLTALSCECYLPNGVELLSCLASLTRLQQLSLAVVDCPPTLQLPLSLSALSGLQSLALSSNGNDLASLQAHLRLPGAWCLTATQVTSVILQGVDLPGIAELASTTIDGSRSGNSTAIFPAMLELDLIYPGDPISAPLDRCQALQSLKVEGTCMGNAGWASLSLLPRLRELLVCVCEIDEDADLDEFGQPLPLPRSLTSLTCLTYINFYDCALHPAVTELPALLEMNLTLVDMLPSLAPGWALPGGPWLQKLKTLRIERTDLGSIVAVLRAATRLSILELRVVPWLRLGWDELPLLLQLPYKKLVLDKRPENFDVELPNPLWDEVSFLVAEELRSALALRGFDMAFVICTEEE